jgi:predicted enzyme related to lactoylglutathione lyase
MSATLRAVRAIRIFVTDLARARGFYGDVLGLTATAAGPGYQLFALGDVDVVLEAVAADDPEGGPLVGRVLGVSFACTVDIEATYRRLSARGVAFAGPPEVQPWGGTLAFARDPDGNVLTLVG